LLYTGSPVAVPNSINYIKMQIEPINKVTHVCTSATYCSAVSRLVLVTVAAPGPEGCNTKLTEYCQLPNIGSYIFTISDRRLFNGLFTRTTWVSRHQKGYTNQDYNEARDDGMAVASSGPYANHLYLTPDR